MEGPQYNPLPTLDVLANTALPFYDMSDNMEADETLFYSQFEYVASNNASIKTWFITLLILGIVFLLLGIAATIYTLMFGKKKTRDE